MSPQGQNLQGIACTECQDRFRSIIRSYYRGAAGMLLAGKPRTDFGVSI